MRRPTGFVQKLKAKRAQKKKQKQKSGKRPLGKRR
jgi:hypothetical protein